MNSKLSKNATFSYWNTTTYETTYVQIGQVYTVLIVLLKYFWTLQWVSYKNMDGFVQDCIIHIDNALGTSQSCTPPLLIVLVFMLMCKTFGNNLIFFRVDRNTKAFWVLKFYWNINNSACAVMTKFRYICKGQAFHSIIFALIIPGKPPLFLTHSHTWIVI